MPATALAFALAAACLHAVWNLLLARAKDTELRNALEAIVAFVLPHEERGSVYDVHVHHSRIQYVGRRGNRPEVTATIQVLHADGANRPVDPVEERGLHEITARLGELGASEGAWSEGAWSEARA